MVCVAAARVAISASTSAQLSSHTVGGAAAASILPARESDRRSRLPLNPVLDEEDAMQRCTFQSKSRSVAGAGTLGEGRGVAALAAMVVQKAGAGGSTISRGVHECNPDNPWVTVRVGREIRRTSVAGTQKLARLHVCVVRCAVQLCFVRLAVRRTWSTHVNARKGDSRLL